MKQNLIYLFLFSIILAVGCRKDDIGTGTIITNIPDPEVSFNASISGIVIDEDNAVVAGALVQLADRSTTTDENGYYKISNVTIEEGGQLVTIVKNGYFKGYTFAETELNKKWFGKTQLITREEVANFNSANGASVEMNGGAKVEFVQDGIKKEDGSAYSGQVKVFAHWYDPSADNTGLSMPGDLRAINLEDQLQQLATYGMVAVELESESGEKLQLKDGTEATITFPLPQELSDAPADIPLWSFDEASGYWKEEGTATREGNSYVAQVSHFSFWNCDAPFPVVPFSAQFVDESGQPLVYQRICLSVLDNGLTRSGWTNDQGVVYGKVPKDKEMLMQVKDVCGNILLEQNIGPFSTDVDLGTITVSNGNYSNTLTGQIVDCNNMPVEGAYVVVQTGINTTILETDADGFFEYTVTNCFLNEFTVYAYDPITLKRSEDIQQSTDDAIIDLGVIALCEDISEFITYTINNGPLNLIDNPAADIVNGTDVLLYGGIFGDTLSMKIFTENVSVGSTLTAFSSEGNGFDNNGNFLGFRCLSDDINLPCDDLSIDFTVFNTNIGQFVEGSFSGNIDATPNGAAINISGSFRVEIDRIYDFASISGLAWQDANDDGIRDAGEQLLENQTMVLRNQTSVCIIGSNVAITDASGNYSFEKIVPDAEYRIYYQSNQQSPITIKDQGSDDTVDCDFTQEAVTDILSPTSGEMITNIDLGLASAPPLSCGADTEGCSDLYAWATGGVAPYIYEVDGITSQNGYFDFLAPGTYTLNVTDAVGNICEQVVFVEGEGQVSGNIWIDQAGGQDGIYDPGIDIGPGSGTTISLVFAGSNNEMSSTTLGSTSVNYNLGVPFPGEFQVTITPPAGFVFVDQVVGPNASDIDPVTGRSEVFFMECGFFEEINIGLRPE